MGAPSAERTAMVSAKHQAVLAAILRAPEDDDVRLVYADLLEEEGEAHRAELIRCQLAGGPEAQQRAEALEAMYSTQLAGVIASYARRWTFSRGLVSAISADLVSLGAHFATLLAAAPIESVALIDEDDEAGDDGAHAERRLAAARAVAACPRLAAIRTLDATFGGFERGPLEAVLASPYLTGLSRLVLGRDTSRPAIRAIAAAHARLPALRALCCFPDSASIDDDAAHALACSPLLAQLEVLELWGTGLGAAGATMLFASASLPRLRHLALAATAYNTNPIGSRGAIALAGADLGGLRTLELAGAAISDAGVAALAGAPWLATLEVLDLDENQLTDVGLLELARSPRATGLTQLSISRNQASASTLTALAQLPRLTRLRAAGSWLALR